MVYKKAIVIFAVGIDKIAFLMYIFPVTQHGRVVDAVYQ